MNVPLRTVRAVCPHDCPDTCGMVVTIDSSQNRAVKLRGDADHPFTVGFLCAKVNHYLDRVYHPDRLKYPMRRVGSKGEGKFVRTSWEAAIREIGSRLSQRGDSSLQKITKPVRDLVVSAQRWRHPNQFSLE